MLSLPGRCRSAREAVSSGRRSRLRFEFSTVHAAKGREADYVVVLDLRDARRGFPSQLEDDPLLDLVLPLPREGEYPHAEERRLPLDKLPLADATQTRHTCAGRS